LEDACHHRHRRRLCSTCFYSPGLNHRRRLRNATAFSLTAQRHSTITYFKSHGFWDFLSLSQYAVMNPPRPQTLRRRGRGRRLHHAVPKLRLRFRPVLGCSDLRQHPRRRRQVDPTPQPKLAEQPVHREEQRPPKRKSPSHANRAPRQFPNIGRVRIHRASSTTSPCACTR
jgi:hypothetical protein